MRILRLLACLAAVTLLPVASSDFHVAGDGPVEDPIPYAPQAFCVFYFDQVGSMQSCQVEADVVGVGVLTIRTNGLVSVEAAVNVGSATVANVACMKPIVHCDTGLHGAPRTGPIRLTVYAWDGIPNAVAIVEVAAGAPLPP